MNLAFNNFIDCIFYLIMRNIFTNFIFSCYQFCLFLQFFLVDFLFIYSQTWFMRFKFDLLDSRSDSYLIFITKSIDFRQEWSVSQFCIKNCCNFLNINELHYYKILTSLSIVFLNLNKKIGGINYKIIFLYFISINLIFSISDFSMFF